MDQVVDVDNAFAKIAATGVSILFASGDSGSGWAPTVPQCNPDKPGTWMNNTALSGTVKEKVHVNHAGAAQDCCFEGGMHGVAGWSYSPPPPPPNGTHYANCTSAQPGELSDTVFTGTVAAEMGLKGVDSCCNVAADFPTPTVGWSYTPPTGPGPKCGGPDPGELKDTELTGEVRLDLTLGLDACCQIFNAQDPAMKLQGWTWTPIGGPKRPDDGSCKMYTSITGKTASAGANSHIGTPVAPVFGKCKLYSQITGKTSAKGSQSHAGAPPPGGTCSLFSKVTGHQSSAGSVAGAQPAKVPVRLWPSWPAISPWVTAVGATRFLDASKTSGEEMASDQFGSGGGFSWNNPQTKAQSAAVAGYFAVAPQLPPKGSYAPTGRATPDVSALGEGFQVVMGSVVGSVGGTSASTPTMAALVSLLNEARVQKGLPPMGLFSTFAYANPQCFNDVTVGTNAIGRGTGPIPYGFNCTKGWDPATGVGTPIFPCLLKAALAAAGAEE